MATKLDWREATLRGSRTFLQAFGNSLAAIQFMDLIAEGTRISIAVKLLSGLLGAVGAGLTAFVQNLGGVKSLKKKAKKKAAKKDD